jgi:hypothetical protein
MTETLSLIGAALLKVGFVAIVVNEIRGFILAAPVLYGVYAAGGTWTAIYLAVCSLGGIALSVFVPIWAARKLRLIPARKPRAA